VKKWSNKYVMVIITSISEDAKLQSIKGLVGEDLCFRGEDGVKKRLPREADVLAGYYMMRRQVQIGVGEEDKELQEKKNVPSPKGTRA
jgi:hypothetical protein